MKGARVKVIPTDIEGLVILAPGVFNDSRGYFMETYQANRYSENGLDCSFVQDNLSFSIQGTVRGLHFQIRHPQAKLVQVVSGEIFDVAVDLREGSATFGKWVGVTLSEENHRQLFVPAGFAHGFCVLSKHAHFIYKCSDYYAPDDEGGILWSDPKIGVDWPVTTPVVSEKDMGLPLLSALSPDRLPKI